MTRQTQVAIVGFGPAGMFCAYTLLQNGVDDIIIVEQGKPMDLRVCPNSNICNGNICDILQGEGGAGGFSDGKITLSPVRGTHLERLLPSSQDKLIQRVDSIVTTFGPKGIYYTPTSWPVYLKDINQTKLVFESFPLRHLGTDGIRLFITRFSSFLQRKDVQVFFNSEAESLIAKNGRIKGLVFQGPNGESDKIYANFVCLGTGLIGTPWVEKELVRLGTKLLSGPADIGIRVETKPEALEPLISHFYDFKLKMQYAKELKLRSFCINANGYVVTEFHRELGIRGLNGHAFLNKKSTRSNFAIMMKISESVKSDPKAFVRKVARLVNTGGGGYPIIQPVKDFLSNKKPKDNFWNREAISTNLKSRPANLVKYLPQFVYDGFKDYLNEMTKLLPGILNEDSVVYAPLVISI